MKGRDDLAKLSGKNLKPAMEPPYRWRDWAISDGVTDDIQGGKG